MNDDNFKKLVEESLKTLSQKLDNVTVDLQDVKTDLQNVKIDLQDVKTDLQNVKIDLQDVKTDLQDVKTDLQNVKTDLQDVKTDLQNVKTDLQEVKDTQENQVLPAVITIESEIKAYGDMYKINNSNSKKLEKRIEVLEDKSGIIPPPEFTLTSVS